MNFLAHIYLSGENEKIKVGNFMADSIRGKKYLDYPDEFQKGILLHRAIDSYTDAHPVFRQSTKRLHSRYRHYSGVIVDIYYDHFLASLWGNYADVPLETYVQDFYDLLGKHYRWLPLNVKKMMPYLIGDNWLYHYSTLEGISRVLHGMDRRTGSRSGMKSAVEDLEEHYDTFRDEFTVFFEDLRVHAAQFLNSL